MIDKQKWTEEKSPLCPFLFRGKLFYYKHNVHIIIKVCFLDSGIIHYTISINTIDGNSCRIVMQSIYSFSIFFTRGITSLSSM